MRRWRCIVCQYIHTGDQPPDRCPVCGASRDKFVEVTEENEPEGEKESKTSSFLDGVVDPIVKRHLHSIAAHAPNGVIPAAVVFLLLGLVLDHEGLANAAFYSIIFVVACLPAVLLFGFVSWKKRYGGHLTRPFKIKAVGGVVVLVLVVVAVAWRVVDPGVADGSSVTGWVYWLLYAAMLLAAGVTGHQGGRLVCGEG